jgi:threonine aldolase
MDWTVRVIDLSSDTATKPSEGMRAAMARAEVGDEQRREDPTVNALQDLVADLTGKEAGLFLPSGTMGNVIALAVHCRRGDSVIVDKTCHIATAEGGGSAFIAQVMLKPVVGQRGVFCPEQIRAELTVEGTHTSPTRLISVENTTNRGGGKVWPLDALAGVRKVADEAGAIVHMDGARLMNAVIAGGYTARDAASYVDSVWVDLSKGLGAPVGAVLCGTSEFIEGARLLKHRLGGAMRQAGVIAAAGLYAFEHNVERLAEDHENAKILEAGIAGIDGLEPVFGPVETNIVFFDVSKSGKGAAEICAAMEREGVRMSQYPDPTKIRAVTHLDVSRADCERAVEVLRSVVA